MTELRYFKRFRMELNLGRPLPPVPVLPPGYFWVPWDDGLIEAHARAKFHSFHGEIDAVVFPSLSHPAGCAQLMRAIREKHGFLPGATWLLVSEAGESVGTVQGVRERNGWGAIQNLGVVAVHRGLGLGAALMLQALHGFHRARLPGSFLEVTAENEPAVRLYRRLGFRCRKTLYKTVEVPSPPVLVADHAL
jgi:ribosomal protein S18 acetylase RimI-like enzyme